VLTAGGWWAAHSPIFAASHVAVSGHHHLSRAQVLRAAGVHRGTNVLWVDLAAAEAAVESNPWVADADVARSLPKTIRISVVERRPASTVVVGSTWFLVASDGTVLGPARHRPRLPVLPSIATVTVGGRRHALTGPARIAGGMTPWLRSRVATVGPGIDGAIQLGMEDGVRVLFGPATDVEAKNQALAGIVRWALERHDRLATIDVRSPVAPSAVPFGSPAQSVVLSHYDAVNGPAEAST
jgi:cell division protein FtsQ